MTDAAAIPEVGAFLAARDRLDAFTDKHPALMREYERLVEEYNQKLEDADHVCRDRAVSCGPWQIDKRQTRYHPERLEKLLGPERFKAIGGTMQTVTQYSIERRHVVAALEAGTIPRAILNDVRTITPNYQSPKKGSLP